MNLKQETLHANVETANSKQIATLKKHFPNCFDRDGNFIVERMQEICSTGGVELSRESYSLNWLGKSYARLLANIPPNTLINADVEHNTQEQNRGSKNLLIKGDNLEVLKHLVNAYSEKVKMIFIDPPYNTGSDDFVYNDDRKFTKEQLSELSGVDTDEAERILSFLDKGSSTHSAWLTFIYPRLYIARELLREDEQESCQRFRSRGRGGELAGLCVGWADFLGVLQDKENHAEQQHLRTDAQDDGRALARPG